MWEMYLQVRSNASSQQNIGTGKRSHGRKSKTQKSESEEYDSLGSDTESGSGEHGINSRKDLDESGPVNFSSMFNLKMPLTIRSFHFHFR